jgi:hypothetical protein
MSDQMNKKLIPFPILIMAISIGLLFIMLVFEFPPMSAHEKELIKNLASILMFFLISYLVFRKPYTSIKEKYQSIKANKKFEKETHCLEIPENFNKQSVQEKHFAFYYPKTWFLTDPREKALYKEAREQLVEPGIKGARNFNISYHDIRKAPDLDKMFQAIIDGVLIALKGSELEFRQNFQSQNTLGMRYKVVYKNAQGLDLCCYQVVITTPLKKNMLIFTFTCQVSDFERSKPLFDQIANLAEIFD